MNLNRLMVFTDFTIAAGVAAKHCYQLAANNHAEVISLHVTNDSEDLEWAKEKSVEQIRRIENYNENIPFRPLASAQNLFQGMNKWVEDQGVGLCFMATHGKKDLQFVTGSNALKLIYNAEVPTVVVQQHTPLLPYKHILIPVFSHYADMQFPMSVLNEIIHVFDAKITLITPTVKTEQDKINLQIAIDRMKGEFITHNKDLDVKSVDQSESKFYKAVILAAQEEDVDLIGLIINTKHDREGAEKGKKFFQSMITNQPGIPVLCL